ncbi:hypothetical protein HU200_007128 [Digitaria exilis]|uniref:Pectinesterase inhibitor domain-containing protein n=1 Tax=Digitaria exilis TaxID=1010633 RepID=A0A835FP85_9POAL|nr:hypothetical protein HU200_007128 [Digitaria exilis]
MSSSAMVPVATILLALAIAPGLAVGSSSVINATCAALKTFDYCQPYAYCVGVLSADPAAVAATDIHGMAAAAVNITATRAASTLRVITDLVQDLTTCRGHYSNMLQSLADVRVDLGAGRFRNASFKMIAKVAASPTGCDILLFEGNAHKDPFTQENGDNNLVAELAGGIIKLLTSK